MSEVHDRSTLSMSEDDLSMKRAKASPHTYQLPRRKNAGETIVMDHLTPLNRGSIPINNGRGGCHADTRQLGGKDMRGIGERISFAGRRFASLHALKMELSEEDYRNPHGF